MTLRENISIALKAVKGQSLRTVLTALIIAIGITALVGILTAIDAVKYYFNSNFAMMGANSFTIRNTGLGIRVNGQGKRPKRFKAITWQEASAFKERFRYPSTVSISAWATPAGVVKYKSIKSNPNITVVGGDENYFVNTGYEINTGRNFSNHELEQGSNVAIIGSEMVSVLFKDEQPLDKVISVGESKYRVIGVLKEKGSSLGFSGDKVVIIPVLNARFNYLGNSASYSTTVKVADVRQMEQALSEATGLFRVIRGDKTGVEDSFEITKSDSLAAMVLEQLKFITLAATIIGLITLIGAGVGLMNIMLVSVTERTREIGIRKSLGATQQNIRRQFLTEAVVICQMGGLAGIVLGIAVGNVMSMLLGTGFILPWQWMLAGVMLCFVTGILSGFYPARKAARLDPIEALRYE